MGPQGAPHMGPQTAHHRGPQKGPYGGPQGGPQGGPHWGSRMHEASGKRGVSLSNHGWHVEAEMLPADFSLLPTTYMLQWQLLETEETPEGVPSSTAAAAAAAAAAERRHLEDTAPEESDADLRLHLQASSDVSRLCSQPCPESSSCAITERLDGFAVLGCRCAWGFVGAACEVEFGCSIPQRL
ncbi:uncharacterized protein EMH_0099210 [Eimeria mitis]|uniref:EGF-like domain-containing protein n=1 Tax=Eimeria mitis TaxID=44415 RepID=U6KH93_9EIME|nr:uncharacterized protein EMH_0099210 [Eimeria mitis]CDJ35642.1 hypothetical protein, conserved [Eimeria mitis]